MRYPHQDLAPSGTHDLVIAIFGMQHLSRKLFIAILGGGGGGVALPGLAKNYKCRTRIQLCLLVIL